MYKEDHSPITTQMWRLGRCHLSAGRPNGTHITTVLPPIRERLSSDAKQGLTENKTYYQWNYLFLHQLWANLVHGSHRCNCKPLGRRRRLGAPNAIFLYAWCPITSCSHPDDLRRLGKSSGTPSSSPPAASIPLSPTYWRLSCDAAQIFLQDLRSVAEMRFRLPTSLSDGITFPQHLIETPGTGALMSQNRLHLKLLFTIDHNGWRWSLHPFKLLRPVVSLQTGYMKDRMNPPGWGQIQPISHWRNHLGNREGSNPPTPELY